MTRSAEIYQNVFQNSTTELEAMESREENDKKYEPISSGVAPVFSASSLDEKTLFDLVKI
jgi:hypothetical protein